MRSFRRTAVVLVGSVIAAACGGDGGTGPTNQVPTADFTAPACTVSVACSFAGTGSDPDGQVTGYSWNYGDGSAAVAGQNTSHMYGTAGTFQVTLTVTDNAGATGAVTKPVTVSPATPTGPTAGFTVTCNGLDCSFTDTSTPAGSLTYDWDFGDATTHSTTQNPSHSYDVDAPTDFTVTLVVTDGAGATATATQGIRVTPPANLQCDSGGTLADCTLDITSQATLTAMITSHDCELIGNRLRITSPVVRTIFFNGCSAPLNQPIAITGPNSDGTFSAGTQIQMQFTQGVGDPEDPAVGTPAIQLEGTQATGWTLRIDDGGNPGGPGEPDFSDIIVTITATP